MVDALYALQGLVPTRDALRDATIADVVACIFIQLGVVLTGHAHRHRETLGNGQTGLAEGVSRSHLRARYPDHDTG
jgi:hypothetical protein